MIEQWLRESNYTVVFTGAGMSTESGLPDFRSSLQGMWKDKDPMKIASTHALRHNRGAFVEFYRMRIKGLAACEPHEGHAILAAWEQSGLIRHIITQNVDGFHQRAGSGHVTELYGSLRTVHCEQCQTRYPADTFLEPDGVQCAACGGTVRPSVVLFGEHLPYAALETADQQISRAELCIVLGSSLQVSPANSYPLMAKRNGARVVIVNMEPTEMDDIADMVVNGQKIGEFLQQCHRQV